MVHLVYSTDNKVIGWEMRPTTPEEQEIAGTIRDMQFFGFDDTHPSYNGLELIDPNKGKTMGNLKRLSWIMKKYQDK